MDERVILTQGGHMMLGYDLVGTLSDPGKHSDALVRRSRECVINLPAADLLDTVVRIGNCSGMDGDKSECFGLTAIDGSDVDASDLGECHARIGRVPCTTAATGSLWSAATNARAACFSSRTCSTRESLRRPRHFCVAALDPSGLSSRQ